LARFFGLVLVAAGFVGLVIDGTRSIVNNSLSFVSVEGLINSFVSGGVAGLHDRVAAHLPTVLWDPVLLSLIHLPASVTGFLFGSLLLWLGQKPVEPIGYLAGR
jgi:hypothetical protein